MKSLGIEVIEIVTGFVQSSILHRGLHAPEGSVYLPIKGTIADIKYQGNANGMSAGAYAASIVEKLMRLRVSPEIWEGGMARFLRFVVTFLPLRLLVCQFAAVLSAALLMISIESASVPGIQAGPCEGINWQADESIVATHQ